MTDAPPSFPRFSTSDLPTNMGQADIEANRFTEAALLRHKREGLELAVKARWGALAVVAVLLPFLNFAWEMLYYEVLLLGLAGTAWLQRRFGRVGVSRLELVILFIDLTLLTFILAFPNPFSPDDWPGPMSYRFENFLYFFVILAAGTLAYSFRTILTIGTWGSVMWLSAAGLMWWFGKRDPDMTAATQAAFGDEPRLVTLLDPNSVNFDLRIVEVVVFLIVAGTLALTVRRFNGLLLGNAQLERERENLSRYFSPNVVAELALSDEPLKQTRTHDVGVLFVDIVGFTTLAADRPPENVIEILRRFHARMEREVFRHGGTLDKYLGDGLMATFGTPFPGEQDALDALRCVRGMIVSLAEMNRNGAAQGTPMIRASFGLHYGPAVLGNIGANRLEFAVIGNTVNVASRLESLTRALNVDVVMSDQFHDTALSQAPSDDPAFSGLVHAAPQSIRGLDSPIGVWTLNHTGAETSG